MPEIAATPRPDRSACHVLPHHALIGPDPADVTALILAGCAILGASPFEFVR